MLDKLVVAGVAALVGGGLIQAIRSGRETKRRRESPLQFDGHLSQQDFIDIVDRIAKTTTRVTRAVTTGLITVLHVRSNSGLTTWTAEVDFNDYGRPTGRYLITSENTQSPIPEVFAKALEAEVRQRVG